MRNLALATSAAVALLIAPGLAWSQSSSQGAHWQFDVPIDLQTINQRVKTARVLCATYDRPGGGPLVSTGQVGLGESADLPLNAEGTIRGVTNVFVRAGRDDPGRATHYVCWLYLDWRLPDPDEQQIELQPRSGTEFVVLVNGALP